MRELSEQEVIEICGGKKWLRILTSAFFTGIVEGAVGMLSAGPAGFVIGFGHGLYDGVAGAVIYEGAMGLTETLHPEFSNNQ